MIDDQKLLLRIEEAAALLSLSRAKLYVLISRGEIPAVRIGGSTRIDRSDLQVWIAEHKDPGSQRVRQD